jgi:hypothetical protein
MSIPYKRPRFLLPLTIILGMASGTYIVWPVIEKRNKEFEELKLKKLKENNETNENNQK